MLILTRFSIKIHIHHLYCIQICVTLNMCTLIIVLFCGKETQNIIGLSNQSEDFTLHRAGWPRPVKCLMQDSQHAHHAHTHTHTSLSADGRDPFPQDFFLLFPQRFSFAHSLSADRPLVLTNSTSESHLSKQHQRRRFDFSNSINVSSKFDLSLIFVEPR